MRNCARREGGRQQRHTHEVLPDNVIALAPDPDHTIDIGRTTAQAVALFGQLSGRQREVMHLCTHDGLNTAEAAEALGIAPATVRVLLHRARRFLRTALLWERR